MNKIDGLFVSKQILESMKEEIASLKGRLPHLSVIIVGEDEASQVYVRNKAKKCEEVGIKSSVIKLSSAISENELLDIIEQLNHDDTVDAILVQLPLPFGFDEMKVVEAIDPSKDVDGFHPLNLGLMMANHPKAIIPCTPKGIIRLLDYYQIELEGKNAVVIGRSLIVGKPIAQLLLAKNATVTSCHSKTKNLKEICLQADIVVVAIGQAQMITEEYIKEGAVVIDVGIHRLNGYLTGDCHPNVAHKASWLTPVPKGVGPMTIAMLLENTLEIYYRRGGSFE